MKVTAQKLHLVFSATAMFLLFSSGIYRHDRKMEDYHQLALQKQFKCVGMVKINGERMGSCVLIGPKTVLTAAHVLEEDSSSSRNGRFVSAELLEFEFDSITRSARHYIIHPKYMKNTYKGHSDIAIVILDREIEHIDFPVLNALDNELGAHVTGVGYGVWGAANTIGEINAEQPVKIAGENIIDKIGSPRLGTKNTVLLCDFDHPDQGICNQLGADSSLNLEYISSGGDSGGGLFRHVSGQWELVGINRGYGTDVDMLLKYGYYGQTMGWTRVSSYFDWIDAFR